MGLPLRIVCVQIWMVEILPHGLSAKQAEFQKYNNQVFTIKSRIPQNQLSKDIIVESLLSSALAVHRRKLIYVIQIIQR